MNSRGNYLNLNKHLKEEFVSNLMGSSMMELSMQMVVFPALVLLRHWIGFHRNTDQDPAKTSLKKNDDAIVGSSNLRAFIASILLDFSFIMIDVLFLTVLSDWTRACAILLMPLLCALAIKSFSSNCYGDSQSLRCHVSSYRVAMMILTCLSILAVDFKIFPRRYAKTETYGTSLMDIGVGSFVLANSLVSRQARNITSREWTFPLKSTSPLLILGVGRLVFTSGVDYQVHVGEYGVHWNFFFTLAAVSILTSLINVPTQYCGIFGSLILVGYQIFLLQGLNLYLLSAERKTDIISQNKEGIFSIFGYWGMYLVGVYLGNYLFFKNQSSKWVRTRVWILTCSFWLLTVLLDRHVERVSRRTCNLAYVTTVLAVNLQVLAILMLSDCMPGSKMLLLEEAFNRNLLGSFLLANVLTGLVNLSANTVLVRSSAALGLLLVYGCTLSVIVGLADFYGVKFKFW